MSLLDRVSTLLRANLNDLVEKAEDPERMLKQVVLDMENQLMQVKTQVAIAIADQQPWAPFLIIASLPLALGAAIWGLLLCRMVWPKRMTDQYIWLKGVHPDSSAPPVPLCDATPPQTARVRLSSSPADADPQSQSPPVSSPA